MRRVIYGYVAFDETAEGPTAWHDQVFEATVQGLEMPITFPLNGRTIEGRLVLQEVDQALWPEPPEPDEPTPEPREPDEDDVEIYELPY